MNNVKELKFQVWDSYKKEWVENFCLLSNGEVLGMDKRMNVIFLVSIGGDSRYIKRQYTGVKDRDGRGQEIYEGDIIEAITFDKNEKQIGKVEYSVIRQGYIFIPKDMEEKNLYYPLFAVVTCEIVGNIFENADLLTA